MIMGIVKKYSAKMGNRIVRLTYDTNTNIVRAVCKTPEYASKYLAQMIIEGNIGTIDAIIYSKSLRNKVVYMIKGDSIKSFLRDTSAESKPKSKKFTDFLSENK